MPPGDIFFCFRDAYDFPIVPSQVSKFLLAEEFGVRKWLPNA
jgi:hypothetical protein